MVQSVARGQFRVTWALDELAFSSGTGLPAEDIGVHAEALEALALGSVDGVSSDLAPEPTGPPGPAELAEPGVPREEDLGGGSAGVPRSDPIQVAPIGPVEAPPPQPGSDGLPSRLEAASPDPDEPGESSDETPESRDARPRPSGGKDPGASDARPEGPPSGPSDLEGQTIRAPPPEPAATRRPPRGQFRVMSAWHALPSSPPPVAATQRPPETPAVPPEVPAGGPTLAPSLPAPMEERHELALVPIPPSSAPPEAVLIAPAASIPPPVPSEPGRVLLGLLARMWLMRAAPATAGGRTLGPSPEPSSSSVVTPSPQTIALPAPAPDTPSAGEGERLPVAPTPPLGPSAPLPSHPDGPELHPPGPPPPPGPPTPPTPPLPPGPPVPPTAPEAPEPVGSPLPP